jgi:hypothetical protein
MLLPASVAPHAGHAHAALAVAVLRQMHRGSALRAADRSARERTGTEEERTCWGGAHCMPVCHVGGTTSTLARPRRAPPELRSSRTGGVCNKRRNVAAALPRDFAAA